MTLGWLKTLVLIAVLNPWLLWAQGTIGDRILFEVEGAVFTQRQMEVYLGLKDLLNNKPFSSVNRDNWDASVKRFVVDMVLDQEASLAGRLQADEALLKENVQQIAARLSSYDGERDRLGIDGPTLVNATGVILRIGNFIAEKEKRMSSTQQTDWIAPILDKAPVRMLDDARWYNPIVPNPK